MRPGVTNLPVASTLSAPAGTATLAPTAAILPSRTSTVPLGMTPRVTVRTVPPVMASVAAAGGAWLCMAVGHNIASATSINERESV